MSDILARKVLMADGIKPLSLLSVRDNRLRVKPFSGETQRTIFISSPVAILKAESVTEFLMDDIESVMSLHAEIDALKKLDDMFRSSSLYYEPSDLTNVDSSSSEKFVILTLATPCRLLNNLR